MSYLRIGDEVKIVNRQLATYNRIGKVVETNKDSLRV